MGYKTIPINDIIIYLKKICQDARKEMPGINGNEIYLSQEQMNEYYEEFGDVQNDDGSLTVNNFRVESIAALKKEKATIK